MCPNCTTGKNGQPGTLQQKYHNCHYPGCGKVRYNTRTIPGEISQQGGGGGGGVDAVCTVLGQSFLNVIFSLALHKF